MFYWCISSQFNLHTHNKIEEMGCSPVLYFVLYSETPTRVVLDVFLSGPKPIWNLTLLLCFFYLSHMWTRLLPRVVNINPNKTLSEPHSLQRFDSMWALSSASGRGRWVWAGWTLTVEPRGHMSLEAIFEAQNYTGQLGGLHLKQQWEQRTCYCKNVAWRSKTEEHNVMLLIVRQFFSLTWPLHSHSSTPAPCFQRGYIPETQRATEWSRTFSISFKKKVSEGIHTQLLV